MVRDYGINLVTVAETIVGVFIACLDRGPAPPVGVPRSKGLKWARNLLPYLSLRAKQRDLLACTPVDYCQGNLVSPRVKYQMVLTRI